jgi:DnaK suppressor protein
MENKKLSSGILNFLKNKLTFKQKELASEQKILNEEDPFLREGREQDGSENLDTVILNDVRKEEIDARKGNISKMQISVKKALAMMNLGTYGKCEVCGAPIDVARLKAYPEATTCLKHAKN